MSSPFEINRLRKVAAGIKHIYEPTAGTGNVIFLFVVLLRVGHEDFAIEVSDAERRITSRKIWVNETVGIYLMKILIEGLDLARMKICRIQKIVTVRDAERCAFVNRAVNTVVCAVIDSDDGVRLIQRRVPTGNGTIFTDKNEKSGRRVSILCHLEERGVVKHDLSSRIACSSVSRGCWDLTTSERAVPS